MPIPKSVVKIKKDGVEYVSSVDRVNYTLKELIRAALRDVGKLIVRRTKQNMDLSGIRRFKGIMKKNTQYWVRHKQRTPNLQVGYKPRGFYAGYFELGTSKHTRYDMLSNATKDHIDDIVRIESQYLSAMENEARALMLIDENEYQGG